MFLINHPKTWSYATEHGHRDHRDYSEMNHWYINISYNMAICNTACIHLIVGKTESAFNLCMREGRNNLRLGRQEKQLLVRDSRYPRISTIFKLLVFFSAK
jgi:hypothetical protein